LECRRPGKNIPLRTVTATVVTFHLVWIAWVFFRAGTLRGARHVFSSILHFTHSGGFVPSTLDAFHGAGLILSMLLLAAVHQIQRRCGFRNITRPLPGFLRAGLFCGGIIWILLWGQFTSHDFIYFQF
jgi:hypothetical protein